MVHLDSESRGFAIGDANHIREIHNSFARAEPFFIEESKSRSGKKEDAYHFVAYLPYHGKVYELDGLKAGPILLGEASGDDWFTVAKPAIEERMNRYAQTETSFALMNLCPMKSKQLQQEIAELQSTIEELSAADEPSMADTINEMRTQLQLLQAQLEDELAELERQRQENIRRRHNYFPFIMTLLKHLSTKGILPQLVEQAKTRASSSSQSAQKK